MFNDKNIPRVIVASLAAAFAAVFLSGFGAGALLVWIF